MRYKNNNRMGQSDISLEKYWVTKSVYFRLATTLALGIGTTYGNLIYCHGFTEGNVDKKSSTLEYNSRTVCGCFNDTFTDDFGRPDLHLTTIIIDDIPHLHKIAWYTPYLIPAAISIDSGNYVSTLTTPADYPDILFSNDPNTLHVVGKDFPFQGRVHRG